MEQSFGPHVTIDATKCDFEKLASRELVLGILNQLPAKLSMTKIMEPLVIEWVDKFATSPGYSGFVMIAESHISVHTFPDQDYVFIDIFSCRYFDTQKAIDYLTEAFGAREVTTNIVQRGLNFDRAKCAKPKSEVKAR